MARPKILLEDIQTDGWGLLDSLVIWTNAEYCAEQLNISVDTLDRRIKEEHGVGFAEYKEQKKEKLRVNLRKKQYDTAMTGNVSMLIWLGKNELDQSDKNEAIHTGEIKINISKEESDL
jgi:hypothetical protein